MSMNEMKRQNAQQQMILKRYKKMVQELQNEIKDLQNQLKNGRIGGVPSMHSVSSSALKAGRSKSPEKQSPNHKALTQMRTLRRNSESTENHNPEDFNELIQLKVTDRRASFDQKGPSLD